MADLEERIGQWRRELAESLGGSAEVTRGTGGAPPRRGTPARAGGATAGAGVRGGRRPTRQPAGARRGVRAGDADRRPGCRPAWRSSPRSPWRAGWSGSCSPRAGSKRSWASCWPPTSPRSRSGTAMTLLIGTLAACYVLARPFGRPDPRQVQGLVRADLPHDRRRPGLDRAGRRPRRLLGRAKPGADSGAGHPREIGGVLVLLWDAAVLAILVWRLLGTHATLLLGLAGNVVVALAWFGPTVRLQPRTLTAIRRCSCRSRCSCSPRPRSPAWGSSRPAASAGARRAGPSQGVEGPVPGRRTDRR